MPTQTEFLTPALVLVAWTLVMWIWMYATRIPAMKESGIDPQDAAFPGTWAHRLRRASVRSVADNYNHLHEQPTIFYAVALAAQVAGVTDSFSVSVAWAYVGVRVVHSLVQATKNPIPIRFAIFSLGSVVLFVLLVRTILAL